MDEVILIKVVTGFITGMMGFCLWLFKKLFTKIDDVENDVAAIKPKINNLEKSVDKLGSMRDDVITTKAEVKNISSFLQRIEAHLLSGGKK